MAERKDPIRRREFLVGSGAIIATAGLGLGCGSTSGVDVDGAHPRDGAPGGDAAAAADGAPPADGAPSADGAPGVGARVVDLYDAKVVDSKNELDGARVKAALLAGLQSLTGTKDLKQAWKILLPDFSPTMRIGLKVNAINHWVASSPALITALVGTLTKDLGADASRIVVWDRNSPELNQAGLTTQVLGVKVAATNGAHEAQGAKVLGRTVRLSRILTEQTDLTISLPVLKDHEIAGITGGLKNIYGCFDIPGSFHGQMAQEVPALYKLDAFRTKTRLFIMEGFVAQAYGGPVGPLTHRPGRLLLATDPVALDSHALAIINGLRQAGDPVDHSKVGWLAEAAKQGLGQQAPKLIKKTLS